MIIDPSPADSPVDPRTVLVPPTASPSTSSIFEVDSNVAQSGIVQRSMPHSTISVTDVCNPRILLMMLVHVIMVLLMYVMILAYYFAPCLKL